MLDRRALLCWVVLAGCARGTAGTMPIAAGTNSSAFALSAAHRSESSLGFHASSSAKKLKFLYDFKAGSDGTLPSSGLLDVSGTLYGTTQGGGSSGSGTVFTLTPGLERVVHGFKGSPSDGTEPWAGLIEVNGTLYGTTYDGGTSGSGTVFKLTTSGKERVLHSFQQGADGRGPVAGLIDVGGTLYGTTYYGGASDVGTVFKIARSCEEMVLHSFSGSDGKGPEAGLLHVNGTLYGTTPYGGADGFGTVFKMTLSGTESVLHSFGSGSDGANPLASLIDVNGTLFGTTASGGVGTNCSGSGCGTIFKIAPSGAESVVYTFKGGLDGAGPNGALIDVDGVLYGTTFSGGTGCGVYGCGTIFKIMTSGAETVIYRFSGGSDGANPQLGSLIDINRTLYGTTAGYANQSHGTAFGLSL